MGINERDQVAAIVQDSNLPYENLVQTLALGILVLSKHDRAETRYGENFGSSDLETCDNFSQSDVARFREQSNAMLSQFAFSVASADALNDTESGNPRTALDAIADWLWGFGQAYAGAVAWSVTLLAIAVLVKYGGGDLIDIFFRWAKPAP